MRTSRPTLGRPALGRDRLTSRWFGLVAGLSCCLVWSGARGAAPQANLAGEYRSPWAVAISADGKTVCVTDATANVVDVLDDQGQNRFPAVALNGQPLAVCLSPDGAVAYVTERGAGTVAMIDTANGTIRGRIEVGRWPVAVTLAPKGNRLLVGNQDRHTISVVDLAAAPPRVIKELPAVREPAAVAVTPDERLAVVANQLPLGPSSDAQLGAEVTLLDLESFTARPAIKLPSGSSLVTGACTSPDGKWAYVVHGLGHFNLPMTQLERGWVNTYALTIIDLAESKLLATMLLDDLTQGSADPFAVVCSADGRRLWISHTGVHEISTIEIGRVHELLNGQVPEGLASLMDGSLPNIWVRIQKDRAVIEELAYDLTALYIADAVHRTSSGGKGPRGIALSADGQTLLAANYFSASVARLDTASGKVSGTFWSVAQPEADSVRRGELLFHDATHCFQRWHSCASCHPNHGRVDGLRWDFADDGFGNGMNTAVILNPAETEPLHRQGTLPTTRALAEHGLKFTHMIVPTEQEVEDLVAYMTSLRPEPSPHLGANGQLAEAAVRGKAIFAGKAECATCHVGPNYTDQKSYNVGVVSPIDPEGKYKTTALLELHRTSPYLHDGRAVTLKDVLTTHNSQDQHGKTSALSADELNDLMAYLLSL